MKKFLLGVIVVLVSLGLGVGGAYALARATQPETTVIQDQEVIPDREFPFRMQPGEWDRYFGPGGKFYQGPDNYEIEPQNTEKISLDDAINKVENYVTAIKDEDLVVTEIKQFENNFIAVVSESDSGKGAFQVIVDPYGNVVTAKVRPLIEWNLKYGDRFGIDADAEETNQISLEDAAASAQTVLETKINGAKVDAKGTTFYGYYTFVYQIDGKTAGLVSVNGTDNSVWVHTSHGKFIDEKEVN